LLEVSVAISLWTTRARHCYQGRQEPGKGP